MKIDENKPVLLIDMGYMCFYRFNASKTWYRFSHPEEMKENPTPKWISVDDFVDKYETMFHKTLSDLVKTYNVPWCNLILCKDCSRKDIWRNSIFSDYKATREASHIKSGFDGQDIFKYTHNTLIPKYKELYNFNYLSVDNAEADDIIAICSSFLVNKYNSKIYIVTSDSDYTQLLNNNIKIVDMKMKERICSEPKKDLWKKILSGDKSDNIPACYINQNVIFPNKNTRFVKCTPKIILSLMEIDNWITLLETNIRDEQHILNQKLIDFNYIPKHIKENTLKYFI